jgi:adenosyl cobinamide kinase/adenosyl cobinamide phosphate guanylyltransferase
VGSIPTSALKYKIMYETLEHWKQYKQEKELQAKIAKEFKLNEMLTHPYIVESNDLANEVLNKEDKAKYFKEFDKWLNKLITKNGTTNY